MDATKALFEALKRYVEEEHRGVMSPPALNSEFPAGR